MNDFLDRKRGQQETNQFASDRNDDAESREAPSPTSSQSSSRSRGNSATMRRARHRAPGEPTTQGRVRLLAIDLPPDPRPCSTYRTWPVRLDAQDEARAATADDSRIGGDGEGVQFRRTRLYMSGDLYDRIVFKSQFDFVGGDVSLKDQYIEMKNIPYVGTVLVGHMKEPFNPEAGDWGAWQIAARYSWIDLQDSGMNGGEEQNVTVALSWHLFSDLRMQFNYTYADLDDTGDVLSNASGQIHAFQTRAQIEF